jgi:SAM-dependent methyltransferase
MRARTGTLVIVIGAAAALAAVLRRHVGGPMGRKTPRGIIVGDAALYDSLAHRLLGPFFDDIAADVAAIVPAGARVLEVGCGPGRLSMRLARDHGLDVTGLDLDSAMIVRARANAGRSSANRQQSFLVGDIASLAFPDGSFDLVVSTLSMHHWADTPGGLNEIARVLRPDGRSLVWDFRRGWIPLHGGLPDPAECALGTSLRVVSATPWQWPWRFALTERVELVPNDGTPRQL